MKLRSADNSRSDKSYRWRSAVVLGLVAGGGIGLVASGLVWVPLLVATYVSWQGLALCEWAPVVGHWTARQAARQSEYRARVSAPPAVIAVEEAARYRVPVASSASVFAPCVETAYIAVGCPFATGIADPLFGNAKTPSL